MWETWVTEHASTIVRSLHHLDPACAPGVKRLDIMLANAVTQEGQILDTALDCVTDVDNP